MDDFVCEGFDDVFVDGGHGHLSQTPTSIIATSQLILSRIDDLIVIIQVMCCFLDKLWKFFGDAGSEVLLEITDHGENILLYAKISDFKEFTENGNQV